MRIEVPALFCVLLFSASSASAHIDLIEPIPRYPGEVSGENKACPCGVGMSNRLCDVDGDRSDPDRSADRITTLAAGSTIIVRFDEYIGHAGRYRVAFDDDGADLADFNANILTDIVDPDGNTGNVGGSIWEIEVTVPDTPCDNCTLQLIQMMDGDTSAPVLDPIGRSSYYQCADIIITGPAAADVGGPADVGVDAGESAVPDSGRTPSDLGGTTPEMPRVVDDPSVPADSRAVPEDVHGTGGCSVGGGVHSGWGLALLMLLLGRRGRRCTARPLE